MKKGLTRTLAGLAFLLALPATSYADTTAITLTGYSLFTDGSWTLGFEFSPTVNMDVTALGASFQGARPTSMA